MKRIALLAAILGAAILAPSSASATQESDWICHGIGNGGYVLLDVPLNSAHFEKHLGDGTDKLPFEVEGGYSCTSEDSDPQPPFNGKILFTLDTILCEGGTAVPGFTVTQLPGKHIYVEFVEDGQPQESVIFTFPPTCVRGATVTNNTTLLPGPARTCSSRRVVTIRHLPKSYKHGDKIRARVGGQLQHRTVNRKREIRLSFAGRTPGIYAISIRAKKHPRVDRLYALCNAGNVTGFNVPDA